MAKTVSIDAGSFLASYNVSLLLSQGGAILDYRNQMLISSNYDFLSQQI